MFTDDTWELELTITEAVHTDFKTLGEYIRFVLFIATKKSFDRLNMYLQFSEPNSIICFVCSHLFFNSDCLLVQNSQMLKEEDDCQLVIRLLLQLHSHKHIQSAKLPGKTALEKQERRPLSLTVHLNTFNRLSHSQNPVVSKGHGYLHRVFHQTEVPQQ